MNRFQQFGFDGGKLMLLQIEKNQAVGIVQILNGNIGDVLISAAYIGQI